MTLDLKSVVNRRPQAPAERGARPTRTGAGSGRATSLSSVSGASDRGGETPPGSPGLGRGGSGERGGRSARGTGGKLARLGGGRSPAAP